MSDHNGPEPKTLSVTLTVTPRIRHERPERQPSGIERDFTESMDRLKAILDATPADLDRMRSDLAGLAAEPAPGTPTEGDQEVTP